MASINASTSGAGGVITTADNTGILNIQTAGTTAVTVNASQNIGIGTASPSAKLSVTAGSSNLDLGLLATVSSKIEQTTGDLRIRVSSSNSDNYLDSNRNIIFGTGASYTERMRILSTGETSQSAAYNGGGATNTAFALNTNFLAARIRARGAENGNNNTSYTEYLAIWSSATGWNVTRTDRAANGNGYGSINLGISGNYVTVSFDVSTIGGWWANVEYFI
jgi:hypothetical protein